MRKLLSLVLVSSVFLSAQVTGKLKTGSDATQGGHSTAQKDPNGRTMSEVSAEEKSGSARKRKRSGSKRTSAPAGKKSSQ